MVTASLINVTLCLPTGLLFLQSMCYYFLIIQMVTLLTDIGYTNIGLQEILYATYYSFESVDNTLNSHTQHIENILAVCQWYCRPEEFVHILLL